MQQVIIEIENGTPKVMVRGVKGGRCKAETKAVEEALGGVQATANTSEMYEKAKQTTKAGR